MWKKQKYMSNDKEIHSSLDENIEQIKDSFGNSGDLIIRSFRMGKPFSHKVASIYINGLTDKEILGTFIIERLMKDVNLSENDDPFSPSQLTTYIKEHILSITNVRDVPDWNKLFLSLLSGETIVLVDG
jgi:spore germination protein KA